MRIDRTFRSFFSTGQEKHRDFKHMHPLNTDCGTISTKKSGCILGDEDDVDVPDFIRLRCRLEPVFYQPSFRGAYTYEGQENVPCELYNCEHPPISALKLVYEGHGGWSHSTKGQEHLFKGYRIQSDVLWMPKILFEKTFLVVRENLFLSAFLDNKGTVFQHKYSENVEKALSFFRPLWGYGGAFQAQMALSHMVQYYCTLDNQNGYTTYPTFSQSYFRERGCDLSFLKPNQTPRTGKIIFVPPFLDGESLDDSSLHQKSLKRVDQTLEEDMVQGTCEITLSQGGEEDGLGGILTYVSIGIQQLGLSRYVDITFQRKH